MKNLSVMIWAFLLFVVTINAQQLAYTDAYGRTASVMITGNMLSVTQEGLVKLFTSVDPYNWRTVDDWTATFSPDFSQLTLSNGNASFTFSTSQNNLSNSGEYSSNNTSLGSSGSNGHMEQITCSYCHGTGKNPSWHSGTCFGQESYHWCDVCQKQVSCSHGAHGKCPSCNGKGYVEKYVQ
jgi:hypothetical protein